MRETFLKYLGLFCPLKIKKRKQFLPIVTVLSVLLTACGGGGNNSEQEKIPPLTVSIPSGGVFANAQQVELNCYDGTGTGCDAIYFTIDGTEPTINSSIYNATIDINSSATLKYFSIDKVGNKESVKIVEYIIDSQSPVVTTSNPGGTYNDAISVKLECNDFEGSGCDTIFYTIDGSDPTINSPEYSETLNIGRDTTLKYFAFDNADNQSETKTEEYHIEPIVSAYYPLNGAQWNDYVNNDGISQLNATDSKCISESCLHGGELRQFLVPGGACDNLNARDSLDIFDWHCIKKENKAYFISAGFKSQKYLSDLINWNESPPVWKRISVDVSESSARLFSTSTSSWWSNPIKVFTPETPLDAESTIYVLTVNQQSNLNLITDKIALVMAPGIILTAEQANSSDLFLFESNYVWVEGHFDGAELLQKQGIVNKGHHNVFQNVQINNVSNNAIILDLKGNNGVEGHNRLVDISVANSATGSGSHSAIKISSPANILHNIGVSNNYIGLLISNDANNNVLDSLVISSNVSGLIINNARNNIISNITSINSTNQSLVLESAENNLINNALLANSNSSGILLNGEKNSINNLVSADNNIGIEITAENNIFTGLVKVGANNKDCSDSNLISPGVTVNCENQGLSDALFSTNVSSQSSFVGKILQDDIANSSETEGSSDFHLITDWLYFESRFRRWGKDGNSYPDSSNQYMCTVGEVCRIWDLSLARNDTGDNGNAVALNVLDYPDGNNSVTHIWGSLDEVECKVLAGSEWDADNNLCKTIFLRNAVERLNDFYGNENGLCESNEACLYTPNIGAYQGHDKYINAGAFDAGVIRGVTLLKHEFNGR